MGEYIHSKQARFDKSPCSCGILEVHHLPNLTPSATLFSIMTALYNKANPRPAAFFMFSDIRDKTSPSRGQKLAEEIVKTFPYFTIREDWSINPRTGNMIQYWVVKLKHEEARKWYQDELANRVEEES